MLLPGFNLAIQQSLGNMAIRSQSTRLVSLHTEELRPSYTNSDVYYS